MSDFEDSLHWQLEQQLDEERFEQYKQLMEILNEVERMIGQLDFCSQLTSMAPERKQILLYAESLGRTKGALEHLKWKLEKATRAPSVAPEQPESKKTTLRKVTTLLD